MASALSREMIDEGYVLDDRHARAALSRADLAHRLPLPGGGEGFLGPLRGLLQAGRGGDRRHGVMEGMAHWAREALPEGVDFVGGTPWPGRELSGLDAALPTLFGAANYILIPSP